MNIALLSNDYPCRSSWRGEERQERRYEFDGHRALRMVGGTEAHELNAANVILEPRLRLHGDPCCAYGCVMEIEHDGLEFDSEGKKGG